MPFVRSRLVLDMAPIDAAWVAGLLEGEGSFINTPSNKGVISLQLTDLDVLQKLHRIVGAGGIHEVHRTRPGGKPCWGWKIGSRADVLALIDQLYPYMGERRRAKMDEIVAVLRPPISWVA